MSSNFNPLRQFYEKRREVVAGNDRRDGQRGTWRIMCTHMS
jgi:hypothetical protein